MGSVLVCVYRNLCPLGRESEGAGGMFEAAARAARLERLQQGGEEDAGYMCKVNSCEHDAATIAATGPCLFHFHCRDL